MEYQVLTIGLSDELFSGIQAVLTISIDTTGCKLLAGTADIPTVDCGPGIPADYWANGLVQGNPAHQPRSHYCLV